MRRLSENEKKHRDMPDYVSGEINGQGGSDKLKASLYHFVKILKDKNDRKDGLWIWGLFEEPKYPYLYLNIGK